MDAKYLNNKSSFIFDAFGTLFKTAPLGEEYKELAGDKSEELISIWRRKQLEYSWLRNQMNQYLPFDQITKDALKYAMNDLGLNNEKITTLLLSIFDQPDLIPGAQDLLSFLKAKNKTLCILSNGTLEMLTNGIRKTGIENLVDCIVFVDELGMYKPELKVYQTALEKLMQAKGQVVFFSSNQWDVSGASVFGLDTVWVNQYEETREILPYGAVMQVNSLDEIQSLMSEAIV